MKLWIQCLILFILLFQSCYAQDTETIVLMRHGEKPLKDLGQLSCQGLNRALALPNILNRKYGIPNYLFAPDPTGKVFFPPDAYDYVRASATIEPTAIKFGLPLDEPFTYREHDEMANYLLSNQYHQSLIFVAWEHFHLVAMAKEMMKLLYQDPDLIPEWPGDDYESLYVFRINWDVTPVRVTFTHDQEGIGTPSTDCPGFG